MKRFVFFSLVIVLLSFPGIILANSSPAASNVTAGQRTDGSGIVDIYYTLSDADKDRCTISIEVSDDGGSSWNVPVSSSALSGNLTNVYPGLRHITWNSKADLLGVFGTNYRVKVTADDGFDPTGLGLSLGLITYYGFDGTSGLVVDEIGTNDAYSHGAARGVTGKVGNAFEFDGINDWVESSSDTGITGNSVWTMSFWTYYTDNQTNGANLISLGTADNMAYVDDRKIVSIGAGHTATELMINIWSHVNNEWFNAGVNLIGSWNHIAATNDGAVLRFYVNGVRRKTKSYPLDFMNDKIRIGGRPGGDDTGDIFFVGKMDEVGIWNRTLSSTEISQLYNNIGNPTKVSNIFTIDNRFDFPVYDLEDDSLLGYIVNLCGSDADPVNTATGNFYHEEIDLSIATRSVPLQFSRYYNNKDTKDGPLGAGWTHSYNIILTDGLGASGDKVSVRWGDGRTEYWIEDGVGGYDPNMPGLHDKLEFDGSSWTLTKKNMDVYNFESSGKLQTIIDKNGNTFTLSYDHPSDANLVTSISDPAGRTVTLGYTGVLLTSLTDFAAPPRTISYSYTGGQLTQVTDALGNTIDYTYDLDGYLAVINDQRDVNTVSNVYDANGRVTQQTDGNGNVTTFTYGTEGEFKKTTITYPDTTEADHLHSVNNLLLMIRYPQGSVHYAYNDDMSRTQIIDRNGNVTNFTYDPRGNVLTTTDPNDLTDDNDGGVTVVEYSDSNFPDLPTKKIDALGRITLWEYDLNGNVERQVNPDGNDVIWTYNGFGQKLTKADENNNATTYIYDSNGLLTQVTDANSNNTWFGYDELWRLIQVTDSRGSGAGDASHTTTSIYDAADRATSVTGPITSQSYEYNQIDSRTKVTNGRGYETLYEYDNNRNLTRTERVVPGDVNQVIQYTYDGLDRKISMTDPNGNITLYEYDALGRLTREINPEADEVTYTYDAHGNVLSVTDGSGITTTYEYDRLHRKIRQSDGLGNSWSWQYDKLGNLTRHTDAKGNVTQYSYDTLNRLVSVTDAANGATSYEYDAVGNLTKITDANSKIIAKKYYDEVNRLVRKEDGHTNAFEYSYDQAGNLISVIDPDSQTKTHIYDNENRLAEVHYPDASQVVYTYDDNGNLISMTDSTGATSYTYDELDRLISSSDSFGKTVQYDYDISSNRTGITYPADSTKLAKRVNYTYDAANRLDKITDWASRIWDYTTDGAGRVTDLNYPSGVVESRTYDDGGRLASLLYKKSSGVNLVSFTYTRDAQGNPTGINETGTLQPDSILFGKTAYTHNDDNRLTSSTAPATYGYDSKGNMTSRVDGVTTTFAYDFENRLISQTTGGSTVQHTYDGMGNRIARNDNGTTTRYILDNGRGMSHVLCETDSSGEIIAYYIHGPTIVGRIAADDTAHYYHTNAIGAVVALTDDAETVTDQYAYTPFGQPAGKTGSTANPFTYVGGYGVMAEDDGLYFMRARFYDPDIGRFFSKDPLEGTLSQPMSLYRYNYANNNPMMNIDTNGEEPITIGIGYLLNAAAVVASTAEVAWDAGQTVYYTGKAIGCDIAGDQDKAKASWDAVEDNWKETAKGAATMVVTAPLNAIPYAGAAAYVGPKTAKYIDKKTPKPTFTTTTTGPQTINYSAHQANVPAFYDPKLNVFYVNGEAKKIN